MAPRGDGVTVLAGGVRQFAWSWQGRTVDVAYEIIGAGAPVLLLPAFSTVCSREEMRPLADRLATAGFGCLAPGTAVVAAGHAAGYALQLGHARPGLWRRVALLAPTWRGPLPTAMGPRPRTYAAARALVRAPLIGQAVYRLNTHRRVIGMMYRRHVYAEAAQVTAGFVAAKQRLSRQPGARFASVAFVTGALDPVADRAAFAALLTPPPAPTLVLCGEATPPKSKAEMQAIRPGPGVEVRWAPGSLGLHEEMAGAVAPPVAAFLQG